MTFTKLGKKLIAFIAVVLLGFGLVGCFSETPKVEPVTYEQAQQYVEGALEKVFFASDTLENITSNIDYLAKENGNYPGVKLEWTSSEEDLVTIKETEAGTLYASVTRPKFEDTRIEEGNDYVTVTLTVKATREAEDGRVAEGIKSFTLKVKALDLDLEGTLLEIKKAVIANLVANGKALNTNDSDNSLACLTYARVLYVWSKSMIVSDGTTSMTVYGSYDVKVGDLVKVQGEVYSYYGQVEFGADISVEKLPESDEHASIKVNEYVEANINDYTTALSAAVDSSKKVIDQEGILDFSGATYILYALVLKEDLGCGDTYALEDPITGVRLSIYHYATDGEELTALIEKYVGEYVNIKAITIDRYSSNDVYRVLWNGEEPELADAPNLTDEQKIELAKNALEVNATATGEYPLATESYGCQIAWELVDGGEVATLADNVLAITQGNASYEITLNATISCGAAQEVVEIKCLVPQAGPMSITDALAMADGTEVLVKGTVTKINGAWSEQYKNMNVTIADEEGNELYLYRLSTLVEEGQIIEVTGKMATYNGARQVAQGATAQIVGGKVSIPVALELADGAEVTITGTVKSVDTAWSEQYKNMSVTVEDELGNTLYVFRLATLVEEGQKVAVTGTMATYKEARQIAAGATAEILPTEELPVETITVTEALAAEDGAKVVVEATVKSVDYAWSDQYQNMSVTLVGEDGATLYVYRLATKVEEGQKVIVTGYMATYKEARQIAAGATAEIVGEGEGGEGELGESGTAEKPFTATEAAEFVAKLENQVPTEIEYYVTGVICAISEISASYGNATYTITDGTTEFLIFRGYYLEGEKFSSEDQIKVGDTVVVKGYLVNYNGTLEMNAKNSLVSLVPGEEVELTDQEMVDALLAELEDDSLSAGGELPLVEEMEGFKFAWTLIDGAGVATLEGYTLTVVQGEEQAVVVLEVTVTYGEASGKKELKLVVAKKAEAAKGSVTYSFADQTDKNVKLDAETALAIFGTESGLVSVEVTNVYNGNGQGGAYPEQAGFLKFGKSKTDGVLKLNFAEGTKVAKVVISCHDWYAKSEQHPTNSNDVSVNGSDAVLAPYNETGAPGELVFELNGESYVEITANDRIFVFSITVYFAE